MKNRLFGGALNAIAHTERENDGSRQSSVFSSAKHIQVMNINTNQLVAKERERERVYKVYKYCLCTSECTQTVYKQLAAINWVRRCLFLQSKLAQTSRACQVRKVSLSLHHMYVI